MSLLIGIGTALVSTLGVVYVGRKGWRAFHRAVGITPGTLIYEPLSKQLALPNLIQLNLDDTVLAPLPPELLTQLSRIDHKADVYQQWLDDLAQQGHTVPTSEAQFVVRKLLNERLPEMLGHYYTLAQHQQRIASLQSLDTADSNNSPDSLSSALRLLAELLHSTEQRLDDLLAQCRDSSYQELLIMQRYLNKLDEKPDGSF